MPSSRCDVGRRACADSGTNSAKAWRSCMLFSHGARSARRCTASSLLAISSTGLPSRQQRQHLRVVAGRSGRPRRRTAPRRHRPATPCTVRFSVRFSAAACASGSPACRRTRTAPSPTRADAGDAVARGLRLARGDADLLADQRVEQRRLADVGPADDGDQAAAPRRSASVERRGFAHGRSAVRTAAGRRAGRWPSARRACGAPLPARRRGASGLRPLGQARAPAPRTRPRRSAHAPGRGWR